MTETPMPKRPDYQAIKKLGESFATEPDYYDRFRPTYSDATFEQLVQVTSLAPDAKLLEIGSGTGIASLPMAQRGYDLICLEPGESLVKLARQKLQKYPNTKLTTSTLEDYKLSTNHFDLIYSAMALHWVNPTEQYSHPHKLLKPGGFLGLIYTEPVLLDDPEEDVFLLALAPTLAQNGMISENQLPARRLDEIDWVPQPEYTSEAADLFDFHHGSFREQLISFNSLAFAGYLHTLSGVINMPE